MKGYSINGYSNSDLVIEAGYADKQFETEIFEMDSIFFESVTNQDYIQTTKLFNDNIQYRDSLSKQMSEVIDSLRCTMKSDRTFKISKFKIGFMTPSPSKDPLDIYSYVLTVYSTDNKRNVLELMHERDIKNGNDRINGVIFSRFDINGKKLEVIGTKSINKIFVRR